MIGYPNYVEEMYIYTSRCWCRGISGLSVGLRSRPRTNTPSDINAVARGRTMTGGLEYLIQCPMT